MKPSGEHCSRSGEEGDERRRRSWAAIERTHRKHPHGTAVVVGHSFVNLTILFRVLEVPSNYFRDLSQDPTGKNVIEFSERVPVLRCLIDTCHLASNAQVSQTGNRERGTRIKK